MNFFMWIREGVKHSVMLGVTDAIEQLGEPPQGEDSRQKLLAFLREGTAPELPQRGRKSQPRRLGRSLRDLDSEQAST